jgi:hypothetical protein
MMSASMLMFGLKGLIWEKVLGKRRDISPLPSSVRQKPPEQFEL